MVDEAITDPLASRVLDAACGSGTFLFQAVRKYIAAAEAASQPLPDILEGVTKHVYGMDLHPVAVTLVIAVSARIKPRRVPLALRERADRMPESKQKPAAIPPC